MGFGCVTPDAQRMQVSEMNGETIFSLSSSRCGPRSEPRGRPAHVSFVGVPGHAVSHHPRGAKHSKPFAASSVFPGVSRRLPLISLFASDLDTAEQKRPGSQLWITVLLCFFPRSRRKPWSQNNKGKAKCMLCLKERSGLKGTFLSLKGLSSSCCKDGVWLRGERAGSQSPDSCSPSTLCAS